MTADTALTGEVIEEISRAISAVLSEGNITFRAGDLIWNQSLARAIEQAVLQSPEVQRLRETLGWQPIETGPRDGTRVILAWGGESINGFFLDNSRLSRPWAGWRTESIVPTPIGQPKHWMPLPPPPQHDNE